MQTTSKMGYESHLTGPFATLGNYVLYAFRMPGNLCGHYMIGLEKGTWKVLNLRILVKYTNSSL